MTRSIHRLVLSAALVGVPAFALAQPKAAPKTAVNQKPSAFVTLAATVSRGTSEPLTAYHSDGSVQSPFVQRAGVPRPPVAIYTELSDTLNADIAVKLEGYFARDK